MARKSSGVLVPGLELDPTSDEALNAQLFRALRQQISEGALTAGVRMPSSRTLAADLGLSRTTVSVAYDQLKSEGYFVGREKSGTFVTDVLPEQLAWTPQASSRKAAPDTGLEVELASRFEKHLPRPKERTSQTRPFNPGIPAVFEFPSSTWSRILRPILAELAPSGIARSPAEGAVELREMVAEYLNNSRGVVCQSDQVLIVSGTRQALLLILMALSDPGDQGWIEDPGYPGISTVYDLFRVSTVPAPVDEEGIVVAEGIRRGPSAKFAYTTPARQAPLGHTMSIKRRMALLNWAHQNRAVVLEDDYDGEYRFGGQPAPSLQSLDPDGRVFYFGTFSKTILPSLGIGYLVVPTRFVDVFRNLLDAVSRPPSLATQLTTAEFIRSGEFEAHIRRMRTLYVKRQNALSNILRDELGDLMDVRVINAGLHLIGYLADGLDDAVVAAKARDLGLAPRPLSEYVTQEKLPPGLLVGFSNLDEDGMHRSVKTLRRAIVAASP